MVLSELGFSVLLPVMSREATPESDIDIAVDMEKPDLFNLIGVKQTVEDKFGVKVDIIRLRDDMNSLLKKRILQDVIYV